MKYNLNEFTQLIIKKYNEPFEILSYNGTSKEGTFKCGYCNNIYHLSKMGKLLDANRKHICSHCFQSQYAEQVLNLFSDNLNLKFQGFGYNNHNHKPTVIYTCSNCSQDNEKPLVEFIKYPTCIHCGKNAKRRNCQTIQDMLPSDFTLIGNYTDQYTKTLFRHQCGFIFSNRPKDIINGHSYCPKCSKKASKGERVIMEWLNNHQIEFIKEKTFEWSNNKRYDFYLPKYNLLIEYMGIQHTQQVDFFQLSLTQQQEIDKWKADMAIQQGFNFLSISYLEFDNIDNILAQRLLETT